MPKTPKNHFVSTNLFLDWYLCLALTVNGCHYCGIALNIDQRLQKHNKGRSPMSASAFLEVEFFALVLFSVVLPGCIYAYMMWKDAISHLAVLLFGLSLLAISGIDVFLLQRLAVLARNSPSFLDDRFFASELSVALYVLPVLFAGIGVNMISHVLIRHITQAEKQFEREHA